MRSKLATVVLVALATLSCAQAAPAPAAPAPPAAKHNATRDHAQAIVEKTAAFQQLLKEHPHLGLMADDGNDRRAGQFDFRAYVENDGGETLTVARYRVDFPHKLVLRYAVEDDAYRPIAGTAALFE